MNIGFWEVMILSAYFLGILAAVGGVIGLCWLLTSLAAGNRKNRVEDRG